MVPLVLGLVEEAGIRSQALDARGFGTTGPRTSYARFRTRQASGCSGPRPCCCAATAVACRLASSWPATGAS